MNTPFPRTRIATAIGGLALMLGASQAFGTGFQLNEQSGSSIGNAFAAGAAFTDDASAMWWNPAALSKIPTTQVIGVLNVIKPSVKFQNNGSQPALNQPLGGDGGDAGGWNFVPNMYLAVPINKQFAFGLGVNVPFGLTTEYDDGWLGRYQALKSSIETMNVNPALSWQVTPTFSVGAGANWQKIKAELTQNVNYSYALLGAATLNGIPAGSATWNAIAAATPGLDGKAKITADDDAWGWNVGLAWDATPQLRLAAAYRSEIKYQVTGNVEYTNPTPAPPAGTPAPIVATIGVLSAGVNSKALFNRGVSSDITLPQIANFSMVYRADPRWELMADVQWTGWSSVPALTYVSTPEIPSVPLNWDDTYKIAVGASYKYSDQWKGRFGVAFDQTPVTNEPTARLPDSDRWWFAIGGEYKYSKNMKFDAGLVYIMADSPSFSNRNAGNTAQYGMINGSYDASVVIVSLQATYMFDPPMQPVPARVAEAPKPAPVVAPPPPPPPAPAPAPAPAPKAPEVQKISLDSKVLFDFDKAVLKPEGMAAIDSQVVGKLAQMKKLEVVLVTGHTDPIGSDAYNQKLSERRAEAVRNYLVSKGVDKAKIEALGMGEKQPVPGLVCEQKNLKEKIACFAPNRRVEVQAKGEITK